MDTHTWLCTLLEGIATATLDAGVRHDLLTDALSPVDPAEAGRHVHAIESHAYRVRHDNHASGADMLLGAAVEVAAYLTGRELAVPAGGAAA